MTRPAISSHTAVGAPDHAPADGTLAPSNPVSPIRVRQLRLIYVQSKLGIIAIFPLSLLLSYLLWDVVTHTPLLIWATITLLISSARLALVEAFLRVAPPDEAVSPWERYVLLGAIMGGATWGLAGLLLFFTSSIPHQMLIIFTVAGVISGSVGTLNSVFSVYRAFSLTAAIPNILIQFLFLDIFHVAIGVMLSVYTLMVFRAAKNMNASYVRTLTLGSENAELVRTLSSANTSMREINRSLQREIRERVAVQEALRAEKERAQVTLASIGDGVIPITPLEYPLAVSHTRDDRRRWHNARMRYFRRSSHCGQLQGIYKRDHSFPRIGVG